MKGTGLILLFTGVGLISYVFNADLANSVVNSPAMQTVSGPPLHRVIWQLFGASGAVVVGLTMIFRHPATNTGGIEKTTKGN